MSSAIDKMGPLEKIPKYMFVKRHHTKIQRFQTDLSSSNQN